jgi:hypothetical protein
MWAAFTVSFQFESRPATAGTDTSYAKAAGSVLSEGPCRELGSGLSHHVVQQEFAHGFEERNAYIFRVKE